MTLDHAYKAALLGLLLPTALTEKHILLKTHTRETYNKGSRFSAAPQLYFISLYSITTLSPTTRPVTTKPLYFKREGDHGAPSVSSIPLLDWGEVVTH